MMAVKVQADPEFTFEPPEVLFEDEEASYSAAAGIRPSYDVGSDGRFLMTKTALDQEAGQQIHVILNWFEELKRLVPIE